MKHHLVIAALALATAGGAAGQSLDQRVLDLRRRQQQREVDQQVTILQALLYEELSVEFDQSPARDVFDFIRTALGVNLIARYNEDLTGSGIDPELPVTLTADKMPALDLLELVLEQCSVVEPCTWQIRKGFLEVGTKERLSVPGARRVFWYPIDELIFQAPKFDDAIDLRLDHAYPWSGTYDGYGGYSGGFLGGGYGGGLQFTVGQPGSGNQSAGKEQRAQELMNLIMDMVEPAAWTANGGDWASMHYRDGQLVVDAPPYILRQIFGSPRVPPPDPPDPAAPAAPPDSPGSPGPAAPAGR